jgi:hypothetical protein
MKIINCLNQRSAQHQSRVGNQETPLTILITTGTRATLLYRNVTDCPETLALVGVEKQATDRVLFQAQRCIGEELQRTLRGSGINMVVAIRAWDC